MLCGKLTLKVALQLLLVVTVVEPMKVWPSPKPEESHAELEKNSMVKVVCAAALSVPWIVVLPPALTAEDKSGKFCRLLGPRSRSHESFCVTPSSLRSIPSPALE